MATTATHFMEQLWRQSSEFRTNHLSKQSVLAKNPLVFGKAKRQETFKYMEPMKHQNMPVPQRAFQWGRNIAQLLAAFALATTLAAQDLPPIPEEGGASKFTPEELARMQAEAELRARERAAKEAWLREIMIQPLSTFSTNKSGAVRLLSAEALLNERRGVLRAWTAVERQRSKDSMERLKEHLRQRGRLDLLTRPVEGGPVPVGFENGAI